MKFTIEKIDRRHNGYQWFQWRMLIGRGTGVARITTTAAAANNPRQRFVEFAQARTFCWQTYGASTELETYSAVKDLGGHLVHNPHWSWRFGAPASGGREEGYIYLAGDAELEFFKLKFTGT